MRRYKVSVVDFNRHPELRIEVVTVVVAYDAKDAFYQVDLLIDRTIQCEKKQIIKVEPCDESEKN